MTTPENAILKLYGVFHSEYGEELSPLMVALQQAAQQEFGTATVIRGDEEIISEAATQWGDVIPGMRVLLRQMYDDTQAVLSEAGVDEVTLYRGIHRIEAPLETELRQPIASMTVDRTRAEVYARVTADRPYAAVEEVTIPASQILSTGSTGLGFNNISEVVILGASPEVAATETETTAAGQLADLNQQRRAAQAELTTAQQQVDTVVRTARREAQQDLERQALQQLAADNPNIARYAEADQALDAAHAAKTSAVDTRVAAQNRVDNLAAQGLKKGDSTYDQAVADLEDAKKELNAAWTAENKAETAYYRVSRYNPYVTVDPADVAAHPLVQAAKEQEVALQRRIADLQATLTDNSKQIADLTQQLRADAPDAIKSAEDAAAAATTPAQLVQAWRDEATVWDTLLPMLTKDTPEAVEQQISAATRANYRGLVERLKGNKAWTKFVKDSGMEGYTVPAVAGYPAYKVSASEQMIQGIIDNWGDDVSVAIHLAMRDEFGITAGRLTSDDKLLSEAQDLMKQYGPGLKAFVRANYDQTQAWFDEHGIENVMLYRGRKWEAGSEPPGVDWLLKPDTETAQLAPIASFSTNPDTALMFTHTFGPSDYRMVIGVNVPTKDILAMPLTGLGRIDEQEMLLIGGEPINVWSVAWTKAAQGDISSEQMMEGLAQARLAAPDLSAAVASAADIPAETFEESIAQASTAAAAATYTLPEIDHEAEAQAIQAAQDALSGDGVASHTDAIDLGSQIDSYIDDRLGPLADWSDEAADIYTKYNAGFRDWSGDQMAWLSGDTTNHGGLTMQEALEQFQAAKRQETLRLLGQVRDVGGTDFELAGGTGEALEDAVRSAQDVFPTDWIEASNDQGDLRVITESTRRGFYRAGSTDGDGVIGLRATDNPDELYTAMVHELGHRMEDSVDGVWQMEQDFYDARTDGEELVNLSADLRVAGRTRPDDFASDYLGRDPIRTVRAARAAGADGTALGTVYSYELLSSGLEWLLGSDYRGAWMLSKDPEYRQFILGILFGAKDGGA